jgi:hypothetical protein
MSAVLTTADRLEPYFPNAAAAIRFAVTRVGSPQRPASSRMLDASLGGRSLSGLDAVAQAGMILNALEPLGRLPVATLIAASAPRTLPCYCRRPCCSGHRLHQSWGEAVHTITEEARRVLPPEARLATYALRAAIVVKIYGGHKSFREIADQVDVAVDTVSDYHRAIHRWLLGAKAGKWGEGLEGIEPLAWREAETVLRQVGIVGSVA